MGTVRWRAVFADGPLAGPEHDRSLTGPVFVRRLEFVQMAGAPTRDGWVLVGTEHERLDERLGWPSTVAYEATDEPAADDAVAVYHLQAESAE